ncbi:MAG TPA: endonuclease domain-containing protein [Allosphingosinicella sp.]|nr:endonuclease domain-containing protein [Allosphingosinicella sp.]
MRKADGSEALDRARQMRREMTPEEELLWSHLRARRLGGFKFKRQEWLGRYIADFYCWEAKLIVEVDGSQHHEQAGYDAGRDAWLKRRGLKVLRFWNNEVTGETEAVLAKILSVFEERVPSPSHPPSAGGSLPLPERERGS